MFWNTIISTLSEAATVSSMTVLLLNSVAALLVSCIIFLSYRLTYSGTAFSKKFMVSLGMMTLVTTIIMNVISNNVALSLGMVGALSIIRFRTAVKDVRDATYIFWCIAVGICCGVGDYLVAGCILIKEEGHFVVQGIAVDPVLRKMGLGKVLMKKALEEARSLGAKELLLVARKPGFYKKLNFTVVPPEEAPSGVIPVTFRVNPANSA